jgi:sulfur-oxidizing protein SoxY
MNPEPHRRQALKATAAWACLLALGVMNEAQAQAVLARGAFELQTLDDVLKALGATPVGSEQITLSVPDVAENGAFVPVSVSSGLAGTSALYLIVENNPTPLNAAFQFPEGALPEVQVRLKLAQTGRIHAVARAEGRLYSTFKESQVTVGGCG